jgi:hypothetical protein
MKKILFLLVLVATTFSFAQSIEIINPGSVGVNLQPATGSFSIKYSLTTADVVYIEAKIGTTLVGSRTFTPTNITGMLTSANFTFNPDPLATRNVGDLVEVTAIQYPPNPSPQVASSPISFKLVANTAPFITLTPPTEADITLLGSAPFKIKYYTTTASPIYIEAKKGGVAVGGRTIPASSVVLGVVTDVEWPNLNKFISPTPTPANTITVGDVLTWQANQFGPSLSSPVVNFTIVGGSLGVNNFSKSNIAAYPNPVQDILTISGDSNVSSYNVLDITGKTVIKNIPATKNIDLSSLKTGQYFLVSDKNTALRLMKL